MQGAGSAGLGVCGQIVKGMHEEGLTKEEAMRSFVVFDKDGQYSYVCACVRACVFFVHVVFSLPSCFSSCYYAL